METENQAYETWDVKKILAALILLAILGLSFKVLVLDKKIKKNSLDSLGSVKGISAQATPFPSPVSSEDLKKSVQTSLDNLKNEVNNINVVDVATSTPAVQKIINDIKNLQNYPQSQAKQTCFQICNGL